MKILIKLPNWLGDAIMLTPSLYLLNDTFKNLEIYLVGNALSLSIFKKQGFIKELILDTTKTKKISTRFKNTKILAKEINKSMQNEAFDFAITFQNNFFSALLLRFINAKKRIGYSDKNIFGVRKFLLSYAISYKKGKEPFCSHQVLSYARLLEPIIPKEKLDLNHIKNRNYGAKCPKNIKALFSLLKDLKLQTNMPKKRFMAHDKILALAPNASFGTSKMWLWEYFCEVGASMIMQGFEVRIYGAKNEMQYNAKIAKGILQILENNDSENLKGYLHDLSGEFNIEQLIDSLNECDFYIGNDSGLTHIARALNISMIAIYGSTPFLWGCPWSNEEIKIEQSNQNKIAYIDNAIVVYKNLSCQPCIKRQCPLNHHNCMKLLTPDEILLLLEYLINLKTKL